MKTGKVSMRNRGVRALVLGAWLLPSCTLEQIMIGQWYTFYTPPAGGCPGLEWQFVVNPQRLIGGHLSRDNYQPVADLSGRLNADDSFQITVKDVAGDRTANVTGKFTSQVSTLSIHGNGAGQACDGQVFNLRLGSYFSRAGAAGGGGGG
jgi:hypothetical protein